MKGKSGSRRGAQGPRRRAPKPRKKRTWYSKEDIRIIAKATGKDLSDTELARFAELLEHAASWFRRARDEPDRPVPSLTKRKLEQIRDAARKLLQHLGVRHLEDAPDGPADDSIIDALVCEAEGIEDEVVRATGQIGRLIEILEGVEGARELERRASISAADDDRGLIVPPRHHGDIPVRNWITWMMDVYKETIGSRPSPGSPSSGKAGGPFIRFLKAAGAPLGIEMTSIQWRNKVHGLLSERRQK